MQINAQANVADSLIESEPSKITNFGSPRCHRVRLMFNVAGGFYASIETLLALRN